MKDKVSIITTYYKDKDFISNSLHSVLSQNYDNKKFDIEYVIVDDNGCDECHQIVESIISDYKGPIIIKHISTPTNLGCGGARRTGISNSTGNYFMFLDADDYYLYTNFVNRAYTKIKEEDVDIIEYGVRFIDNKFNKKDICVKTPVYVEKKNFAKAMFEHGIIRFSVWSKIYKADIVHSHIYSNYRTYEDIRTIPIWIYNTKRILIMNTVEINYRYTNKSIIRTNPKETRFGTLYALEDICSYFKNDIDTLKSIYKRALIDLKALMISSSSVDEDFNKASSINTKMLSYIFPENYKKLTYNI